jgi:hypothetical protein
MKALDIGTRSFDIGNTGPAVLRQSPWYLLSRQIERLSALRRDLSVARKREDLLAASRRSPCAQ